MNQWRFLAEIPQEAIRTLLPTATFQMLAKVALGEIDPHGIAKDVPETGGFQIYRNMLKNGKYGDLDGSRNQDDLASVVST